MKEVTQHGGTPKTTFSQASTNTAAGLTAANIVRNGKKAIGAIITCETNSIRYAFNVAPTQAGLGHLLTSGSRIVLDSVGQVEDIQIISAAADTHGTLQVTPLF